jgi:acylphosphatase
MMSTGCRVIYTGRVQGVGFRYRAIEITREFPVIGWVKNLPTGQVEFWAEGNEDDVKEVLAAIRVAWGSFIRSEQVSWEPATGTYASFDVTY